MIALAPGSIPWMIRHELRLTWRYMIGMMGGKVRSMVILTIVMVVAAFAIGIPMGLASRLLTTGRMDKAWPFMVTVADGAALFVFTLMLAQSLSMATIVFYDRGDLDLLLTAPLKPGRILMVRTLAMVANAMWGFLAFVAPFLICSAVIGGHWGWLAGFPMIMAFSLLATALGVDEVIERIVARDFSDVRTVAAVYAKLMDEPAPGQVFNVCSGATHTLREVLEMASSIAGYDIEVRVNPEFVRDNEVRVLRGSPVKLHAAIGDVEHHDLLDTLRWMFESA